MGNHGESYCKQVDAWFEQWKELTQKLTQSQEMGTI